MIEKLEALDAWIAGLVEEANWMQTAVKRPGAFRAKASKAGMTSLAFAQKVKANPGRYDTRTRRQANLALTFHKHRKS